MMQVSSLLSRSGSLCQRLSWELVHPAPKETALQVGTDKGESVRHRRRLLAAFPVANQA